MKTKLIKVLTFFLALTVVIIVASVFVVVDLIKENNKQKENASVCLELVNKTWYIVDESRVSSEENSGGYIIELPEKLREIRYSEALSGKQNPVKNLLVVFENSSDESPEETTGNDFCDGMLVYHYR